LSQEAVVKPIAVVVLPTYNEAENLPVIIPAIFRQQEKIETHHLHVLVVDDNSPDGSQDIVRNLMPKYPRLDMITGDKKGLGEAYKRGMSHVNENLHPDLIFEMDADLQHDPDLIPLFVILANHGYSLIIGSRFTFGGATPDFSLRRRFLSVVGNWLLRFLAGLPPIRDCTSGYRCIKADLLKRCDLSHLSTRGYSFQSALLFELVRNNARILEIPIVFPDRQYGESKLALRDQVEFMINVLRIRFQKSEEFIRFCIVGASGVLVNLGLYILLTRLFNVPLEIASPIAIETSILTNFTLNHIFTFKNRQTETRLATKLARFHIASGLAGLANYLTLLGLFHLAGLWDILSNLIGIGVGTMINYYINSRWTWKEPVV
jgi:dolichol-phosphate mannosyltransferase